MAKICQECKYQYLYITYIIQQISLMTDKQFPTKHRVIANSLEKLNRAASQGRFRIKSLRVKTGETQQQKCATERDYQLELIKKSFSKDFLRSLYIIRSQQTQVKPSQSKYQVFVKTLFQKITNTITLNVSSLNFQKASSQLLLKQFININTDIISYDLSKCSFLSGYDPRSSVEWGIEMFIKKDKRIVRLLLKNMGLNAIDIKRVFDLVIETSKIFELDISNQNSQNMNRFGQSIDLLYDFFKNNQTTSVINLDNLTLRKQGVQHIHKGVLANPTNPLKILSLKNNAITQQSSLHISLLARSGLVSLDISQNPLGPNFYLNLPTWKQNTVKNLNLSCTDMNSEALIFFLSRLEENKCLQILKLDRNDFSHHWFNQIKQILEINTSLQSLSLVDCKIKSIGDVFTGLLHNRYMIRLNISGNQFQQGSKQLCVMIKQNKTVAQIRMRFCGLKAEQFIKIFEALIENDKIYLLDISQNLLGEDGAKQILKTLSRNSNLSTLITQKVQIPFNLKQQIDQKIIGNRNIKKARQLNTLKKQNKIVKKSDVHTWDHVQALQSKVKENSQTLVSLQSKVNTLQKQYQHKKHRFNEVMKECQSKQQQFSSDILNLRKKIKQLEVQQQNILKKFKIKEDNIRNATSKQEEHILNLEKLIIEESKKNQIRQNQLQDQYQNFKYIQKKKQAKRQSQPRKSGFDASIAVNSKRKSKNV